MNFGNALSLDSALGTPVFFLFVAWIGGVAIGVATRNIDLMVSSISGPTPFVYRYALERSGTGTLLRLEGSISADGLGGPLAMLGSVAEVFFKRGMASNLETFKRLVESG